MDGFLDSPFEPAIFSLYYTHMVVFKGVSSSSGVAVLLNLVQRKWHVCVCQFMDGLFGFPQCTVYCSLPDTVRHRQRCSGSCPWGGPVCLRVLEGLNCTRMPCFWSILVNCSENSRKIRGLSVLVFQDQSGVIQRVDVLQTGTCPGEYGLSCRGKAESGGVKGGSEEVE